MKKYFILFFFASFAITTLAQKSKKAVYTGHISYTKGNFGSFNYPVSGDSVIVTVKDSSIEVVLFPKKQPELKRNLEVDMKYLKLVKSREYGNIVAPDKTIATGNYDMKFESKEANAFSKYSLYLTHYSDGTWAELVLISEHEGLRADDLFIAEVIKMKK